MACQVWRCAFDRSKIAQLVDHHECRVGMKRPADGLELVAELAGIRPDKGHSDLRSLPEVVVVDLGDRATMVIPYPGNKPAQFPALVLE